MGGATPGGPYRVPRHDGGWRAFALALATHALLVVFLVIGINWQNTAPVAVEAEVWDLTTQQAAPPPPPAEEPEPEPEPVPPPPAPTPAPPPPQEVTPPKPDPEIALKREREKKEQLAKAAAEEKRKQKAEEDRLAEKKELEDRKKREQEEKRLAEEKAEKKKEDEAKKKLAEKKAAEKRAADQLAKMRAEEMRRITGAAGGTAGTAEKSTAPRMDSGYVAAITAKIKSNISYAGSQDVPGNPRAEFKITQLPTGEIISVRKIKSSGIPAYDAAVENAIAKSSPLPKKKDGTVERDISAAFNLKDLP